MVTVFWTDIAMIGGALRSNSKNQAALYTIRMVGDADIPTANASDAMGITGEAISVMINGFSTDSDVALGRSESEDTRLIL